MLWSKTPVKYLGYVIKGGWAVLEMTGTLMGLMVTLPAFAKSMLKTNTYSPIVFKLLHPKSIWGAYNYLMKASIIKSLKNETEYNKFSYVRKFEPNMPHSLGEILFEKPQTLQRIRVLIKF